MNNTKIFMMCHRPVPYGFIDNDLIQPLECGAALRENHVCSLLDNTGDNISDWNGFYLENTAIYWIWKNVRDADFKGQMQYRRRLNLCPYTDFERLFKDYDAIIAEPLELKYCWGEKSDTVEKQYALAHCLDDLKLVEDIIREKYPEYAEDYDRYIKNDDRIFYSNGWILPSGEYDRYCEFLFGILDEWLRRRNIKSVNDVEAYVRECIDDGRITCSTMAENWRDDIDHAVNYQMRIGGSLSERIFTLYARHNFRRIYLVGYKKEENIGI